MRRGQWLGVGLVILGICSLLESAPAADIEQQELELAVKAVRKENAALKKLEAARQKDWADATNQIARLQARIAASRTGLIADDDEARASAEWRMFLQNALKVLADTDRECRELRKELGLLTFASREALKTADKVDPGRRSLLEGEIRKSGKMVSGKEDVDPKTFIKESEPGSLEGIRVVGVRLDLGVAALAVGKKQGARVGMPFLVEREKKVLATLTLVEVREKASLALIEQMDADKPVREGDTAELRKD